MFGDGVFWRALVQIMYDPTCKVTPMSKTDQTIVKPEGVKIQAIWFQGKAIADMDDNVPLNSSKGIQWRPSEEVRVRSVVVEA